MTVDDILTSSGNYPERVATWPPTVAIVGNATVLSERITRVLFAFGTARKLSSGYRPDEVNEATPGAAKNSHHKVGEAGDVEDHDGTLGSWCLDNLGTLEQNQLWIEDPEYTPGWVHFQIVPPPSGRRVFIPYAGPPPTEGK